jgi:hypothetical protein
MREQDRESMGTVYVAMAQARVLLAMHLCV